MRLSIVIPTFNRARLLAETIPALAGQEISGDLSYEVIFVSNGSTDETPTVIGEAVRRWPHLFRFFQIDPTGGPSAPRNVGIRAAGGDVIVILDDDVLPEPGLVLGHARFHREHPEPFQAAIGEAYVPRHLLDDPMSRFHIFPYDEVRALDRLTYLHFWTCNVSVKREFMLRNGMFDENFLYYEDILCGHGLESAGMQLRFCPEARGQHLHQMTPAGLPAKGRFLGRWLPPFLERIPDPAAMARLGVLSLRLPLKALLRRVAGRIAFRAVDNPITLAILEAMGANRSARSALTDFYYGLIFQRNLLAGYNEAKREAGAGRPMRLTHADPQLADRGDK